MGEIRNAHKILVKNLEETTGRPRRRWENIKMDHRVRTEFIWLRIWTSGGLL
jgi:hypothetical protein